MSRAPGRRSRALGLAGGALWALGAGCVAAPGDPFGDDGALRRAGERPPAAAPGERDEPEAAGSREPPPPAKDEAPARPAGPGLDPSLMLGVLASTAVAPGRFEDPARSAAPGARPARVFTLRGRVEELGGMELLGGRANVALRGLADRLAAADRDDPAAPWLLRVGELGLDAPKAHELGQILRARAPGRALHCHAESLDGPRLIALGACDTLTLAPGGDVAIAGFALMPVHLKGLLDRLGVEFDVVTIGAFKGAAEPLTRRAPSPELELSLRAIVERANAGLTAALARRIPAPERRAELLARGLLTAEQARAAGLVDAIAPFETWRAERAGPGGWVKDGELVPTGAARELQRFLGLAPAPGRGQPHVAVVYAIGGIVDGPGRGVLGAREELASHTVVPAIRALAADDEVVAVVLRIDSGGGSARASEQIWQALSELAATKPLVVSMSSVAASGGYYIAAPARRIFAQADTLTGSIGVLGGKLVYGPALAGLGVDVHEIASTPRATWASPLRRWDDEERETIRATMAETYELFLARVAAGRGLTRDQAHEFGQGRVWTGADALARGLVDELGGLDAALAWTHREVGLDPGTPLEIYPPELTLRDLLSSFGAGAGLGLPGLRGALWTALGPQSRLVDPRLAAELERLVGLVAAVAAEPTWAVELAGPAR